MVDITITQCNKTGVSITWHVPDYYFLNCNLNYLCQYFVSCTILNYEKICTITIPWLLENNIIFKFFQKKEDILNNNIGRYGYLNAGRTIIIFLKNKDEVRLIEDSLCEKLKRFQSPALFSSVPVLRNSVMFFCCQQHRQTNSHVLKQPLSNLETSHICSNHVNNLRKLVCQGRKKTLLHNRFIILKIIRQRVRGGVYLALDTALPKKNRVVILKEARVLTEIEENGVDSVTRLQWQHTILTRLSSENFSPDTIGYFNESNVSLLEIEHFNGTNLLEFIRKNMHIEKTRTQHIIEQLCQHVVRLHNLSIFFFDLSPDNIMLTPNGDVKIVDFETCFCNGSPPIPGWDKGTEEFFPPMNSLVTINSNQESWYCLRDIYGISMIFFCLLFPSWYEKLFDLGTFKEAHDEKNKIINDSSQELQRIFKKSFLIGAHYDSVSQLYQDITQYFYQI